MSENKEFEEWYCKEQVENTLFPLLGKLYTENKSILQSVWEASAKIKQSEIDKLKAIHLGWLDKTEWVQNDNSNLFFECLGMHRADALKHAIIKLQNESAKLLAEQDEKYNKQTNDLITRHAKQIARLEEYHQLKEHSLKDRRV